jgi:hypothetical protein
MWARFLGGQGVQVASPWAWGYRQKPVPYVGLLASVSMPKLPSHLGDIVLHYRRGLGCQFNQPVLLHSLTHSVSSGKPPVLFKLHLKKFLTWGVWTALAIFTILFYIRTNIYLYIKPSKEPWCLKQIKGTVVKVVRGASVLHSSELSICPASQPRAPPWRLGPVIAPWNRLQKIPTKGKIASTWV